MSECPTDAALSAVLVAAAPRQDIVAIHEHAERCERCRGALAAIARVRHEELAGLPLQRRVGRFVIQRELGRGGMGVVYAASDDVLRRTVAVKLIARQAAGPARALLEEARGMARVDHPNVVSVLEVSTQAGQVYLAMDFVDGPHLGQWLLEQRRDWKTIVATFVGAARGLSAIHAAGLVHRDFKPHNVMVGSDGRARVTDFGLVRSAHVGVQDAGADEDGGRRRATGSTSMRGTPRYMAPEQIRGEVIDGRADQFSFCASLYEALAGVPPHGSGSMRRRLEAIVGEELAAPAAGRTVPGSIKRVMRRGLRNDPTRRYPNMSELCRALEAAVGRRSRVRRLSLASLGVVGAVGLGLTIAAPPPRCPTPDAAVDEALPASVRATLPARVMQDAVTATEHYVDAWASARIVVCNAGLVRAEVSDLTYDAMMRCLKRRRLALASVVAQADDDPAVASQLGTIVRRLDSPRECGEAEFVRADAPIEPTNVEEFEAVAAELTKAAALRRAELVSEARTTLEAVAPRVEAGGWPSLEVQLQAVLAEVTMDEGDSTKALAAWRDAHAAALMTVGSGRQWREVVLGGVDLHTTAGSFGLAEDLLLSLEAVQRRDPLPFVELRAAMQRSALEIAKSDLTAAESTLRRVVKSAAGHDRHLHVHGQACGNLAVLLCRTGRCPGAQPWFQRAIASFTELYGPNAPDVLEQRSNLGVVLTDAEDYEGARREFTAVVDAAAAAGLRTQEGQAALRLARVEREVGNLDAALAYDRRAEAIYSTQLRDGDPRIADSAFRVGRDLLRLRRTDQAIVQLRRAWAVAHWEPSTVDGLAPLVGGELAVALSTAGRTDEAMALIDSVRLRVEAHPVLKDHRYVSGFYGRASEVYETAAHYPEMLAAARRADELLQGWSVPTNERRGIVELIERAEVGVAGAGG